MLSASKAINGTTPVTEPDLPSQFDKLCATITDLTVSQDSLANEEAAATTFETDADEVILRVPHDVASYSLGFAIDAGGSVTKLIYRSKKDYENGKLKEENSSHGKLRFRFFPNGDGHSLAAFIAQHCDVIERRQVTGGGATDEQPISYQTGCHVQAYISVLNDTFNTRTRLLSEMDALTSGVKGFHSPTTSTTPSLNLLPVSPRSVAGALLYVRALLKSMEAFQESGDETMREYTGRPGFDSQAYITGLMTSDSATLAQQLSLEAVQYPCLFVVMGSCMVSHIMYEDGRKLFCDISTTAGKTALGIGMGLTGAKDFNELLAMASRGDYTKVDTQYSDVRLDNRTERDWYNMMSGDITIFRLGKLSEHKYRGSYSNDDVAAALLRSYSAIYVKVCVLVARLHKMTTIAFAGSFVSHPFLKEAVEEAFFVETLMLPLRGEEEMRMGVVDNPGYLCAVGTWKYNVELQRKEAAQQNVDSDAAQL